MTSELTDDERAVLDGYFAQKQVVEIARLREQVRALREALTPSPETKAAYLGEIRFPVEIIDENGDPQIYRETVPWTSQKEFMAMILARADAATAPKEPDNA